MKVYVNLRNLHSNNILTYAHEVCGRIENKAVSGPSFQSLLPLPEQCSWLALSHLLQLASLNRGWDFIKTDLQLNPGICEQGLRFHPALLKRRLDVTFLEVLELQLFSTATNTYRSGAVEKWASGEKLDFQHWICVLSWKTKA